MKYKYCYIVLLVSCLSGPPSFAAGNCTFRTVPSLAESFHDKGIKATGQDGEGFIRILTEEGLYRFDGFRYKRYDPYSASADRTTNRLFHNMACTSGGDLYANTGHGIYFYNRADRFKLQAAYNDGVRSDRPTVPAVKRQPAPWFGGPVCPVCFILFMLAVTFILRYHSAQKKPVQRHSAPPGQNGKPVRPANGKTAGPVALRRSAGEPDETRRENKKRILLAADRDGLRHLIAGCLAGEFEVMQAEDGMEAAAVLSGKTVDLIICDLMMPEKDGIAFSREVKENVETSHIPLVLLTAKTGLEGQLEGADAGADLYFEKPVDCRLLLLSVKNIFRQQQRLKEYYSKNAWADTAALHANEKDGRFLKQFTDTVEKNIQQSALDVNFIACELSMSRSKLYAKIKTLTGRSIVEFILSCRLRKAARLLVEQTLSVRQIMEEVGIESPSYFSRAFKKEFGLSPSEFLSKSKKRC